LPNAKRVSSRDTGTNYLRRTERPDWTPYFLLAPNLIWLLLFMAGALLLLGIVSFRGYEPGGRGITDTWELTQYVAFLSDPFFLGVFWRSLVMALEVTLVCLLLGFPLAYWLSQLRGTARAILYLAILIPLLTSAVVRTFGWMLLLANNGFLNKSLVGLGVLSAPLPLMYNQLGIVVALAEVLLPFMVLALDAALLNIDGRLYDAARNLGAGAVRIFLQITLPLSMPGIVSGSVLVFTLAISAYVTPALIGGPRVPVMSTMIYQQGIALLNWPFGAAIAFILLLALILLLAAAFQLTSRATRAT
jgi:putative spermidine/putrescine transport system permease protein